MRFIPWFGGSAQAVSKKARRSKQSSIPSLLFHPLTRLRWLYARIRAERHDALSPSFTSLEQPSPAPHRRSIFPFAAWIPLRSFLPGKQHHGGRPRSFYEIVGRKALEANCMKSPCELGRLDIGEVLERALTHLFYACWWKGEWACYCVVDWIFRKVVSKPTRRWAEKHWWWGYGVLAWRSECHVVPRVLCFERSPGPYLATYPLLREIQQELASGQRIIDAAVQKRGFSQYNYAKVRLKDLLALSGIMGQASVKFALFYLRTAKAVAVAEMWKCLGFRPLVAVLDFEPLDLD